jgi:hypothetical protein
LKLYSGTQENYDKWIASKNRSWSAELRGYDLNPGYTGIESKFIKSISLSDYSVDGQNITMGSVVGQKLTINIMRISEPQLNYLSDSEIVFLLRLLDDKNATIASVISGRFVIDNEKRKPLRDGVVNATITAYDKSYLMTHKYVTSLTEPTCLDIVNEIADKYGLGVNSSVQDAVTAIDGATPTKFTPLADFTYKQTLGFMAGCYGCFAYINESDEICFGWYSDSGYTIERKYVYDGSMSFSEAENRTIVMLETGTKSNPIVSPNNASGHSINFENPYITQAQADAIYTQKIANGKISYRVGKAKYKGNPLYSPGTIVTVKDIQAEKSLFYIMKRTLNYDGGLSETIESLGESETTISFKITSPTQQKIDRALSKMEEAIKKATDIITQTKGSIFEVIPIDENDPSKGNSGWKLYSTEIGSNNLILANSSGIGFSSNGGQSMNAAAIYIDKDGYGHINANFINVGELDGSLIKAGTIVVGKNDVDGLDDELADLLKAAEDAGSKANTAQNTANTASANASSALSVANSANGKIANWASANDTTLINGAKIYTGSITAKQIAADSITADKLSVGTGVALNQFYNDEFYDGDRGWYGYNGSLYSQYPSTSYAFMQLYPSGSGMSIIMQKLWLVQGQRYAIAAQINPTNWNQNGSTVYIEPFYGSSKTLPGQNLSYGYNYKGETVVKMVFDYPNATGFVDVGIAFRGIMETSTTASKINIAWMSFSDAADETVGFYCTRKEWLASGYKESNYIGDSVDYETTADAYLTKKSLSIDEKGNLVTLGTIKSNSGEIGSMVYNRDRMDITTHAYYKYVGLPTFASSRISFINPPEYYEFTATSPSYKNSAEEGQRLSARIEVASSARITTTEGEISGNEYTMITSSGVSVSDSSGHSSISANGINIDGVSLTKSELEALKRLI